MARHDGETGPAALDVGEGIPPRCCPRSWQVITKTCGVPAFMVPRLAYPRGGGHAAPATWPRFRRSTSVCARLRPFSGSRPSTKMKARIPIPEKVRKMAASPALASATGNSKPIRKVAVQVRTRSVVSNARAHDVDLHLLAAFFLQGRAHGFDLLATRANNGARCSGVNRERHEISLIAPDINLSDGGVGIAPLNKRP